MFIHTAKLTPIEPLYQMVDVRLPNATFLGDRFDMGHGAGSAGVLSSFGPFLALPFDEAMKLIIERSEKSDMMVRVDPKLILSQPYDPQKMMRAIQQGLNTEPPVVDLEALVIPTVGVVYHVVDGMHRSFAARYYGRSTIEARVWKFHHCNPHGFFLDGRSLCRIQGNRRVPVSPKSPLGSEVPRDMSIVTADQVTILQSIGCPSQYAE